MYLYIYKKNGKMQRERDGEATERKRDKKNIEDMVEGEIHVIEAVCRMMLNIRRHRSPSPLLTYSVGSPILFLHSSLPFSSCIRLLHFPPPFLPPFSSSIRLLHSPPSFSFAIPLLLSPPFPSFFLLLHSNHSFSSFILLLHSPPPFSSFFRILHSPPSFSSSIPLLHSSHPFSS